MARVLYVSIMELEISVFSYFTDCDLSLFRKEQKKYPQSFIGGWSQTLLYNLPFMTEMVKPFIYFPLAMAPLISHAYS